MRAASEARMARRLKVFIFGVTVVLFACIIISISGFQTSPQPGHERIGMILSGGRRSAGWDRTHYEGLKSACLSLGKDLVVRENVAPHTEAYQKVIKEFSDLGIRKVVINRHSYPDELRELLRWYPDIKFILATTELSEKNMVSYSLRFYEGKYLAGVLAGSQTETGVVGYVAPYESLEVNRDINAFALGVWRANPDARVKVAWTGSWMAHTREHAAVEELSRESVDVLTYSQDGRATADAAEQLGIDYIDAHEMHREHRHCLTAVISDWERFYHAMLQEEHEYESVFGTQRYGMWQGIFHNVIRLAPYNEWTGRDGQENVARAMRELHSGRLIFAGEIYDRSGKKRCGSGEAIANPALRTRMNWLIRGVESIE